MSEPSPPAAAHDLADFVDLGAFLHQCDGCGKRVDRIYMFRRTVYGKDYCGDCIKRGVGKEELERLFQTIAKEPDLWCVILQMNDQRPQAWYFDSSEDARNYHDHMEEALRRDLAAPGNEGLSYSLAVTSMSKGHRYPPTACSSVKTL